MRRVFRFRPAGHVPFAVLFPALLALAPGLSGGGVEERLTALRDSDAEVRLDALRAIQTSLDVRIPDAVLPLLEDEGNTIRRLAARAIGSRWWQINDSRVPGFVAALGEAMRREHPDDAMMALRATGLLTGTYDGPPFARSRSGRWVLYERYSLPCLLDVETRTEELLGWEPVRPGWIKSAWGPGFTREAVHWHPDRDMAAIEMILSRRTSAVWVWVHGEGLQRIGPNEALAALGLQESQVDGSSGIFIGNPRWHRDDLVFEIDHTTMNRGESIEHKATLRYSPKDRKLQVANSFSESLCKRRWRGMPGISGKIPR